MCGFEFEWCLCCCCCGCRGGKLSLLMIVFGVWAEIVQASFFCACVSSCCCCNTAIHRGHKVSLYLNQGNPDVAGLFTLLLSVYLFSVWIKEGFKIGIGIRAFTCLREHAWRHGYCVCGMSKDSPIALFSCVYKESRELLERERRSKDVVGETHSAHTHTLKAQAKGIKRVREVCNTTGVHE